MATIDMTHRKLKFPPRFLPYLEKHRIFELFHECVELLVQMKPKDHIKFLKNVLPCAAMKKDKQRIVFISPATFDRTTFSQFLADCLGIQNISLVLLELLTKDRMMASKVETKTVKKSQKEEEEEEEICICPGEDNYEIGPLYYPAEEESYRLESAEIETTKESEEKQDSLEIEPEETKPPCVCVCPCVKEKEEENENTDEDGKKETENFDEDGRKENENSDEDERKETENFDEDGRKENENSDEDERKENYNFEKEEENDEERIIGDTEGEDWAEEFPSEIQQQVQTEVTPCIEITTERPSEHEIDFGILAECETSALGWILQDFPKTGAEAEKLNAMGIIPTHALRIIIDDEEEENNREYKMAVKSWMRAYKYVPVTTIRVRDREMPELAKDLCSLLSIMPHRHAPMLPRIVLIGSRGSGVTTQGQKLAQKYGLVHVEFETVIAQALQKDDDICKLYKIQLATRPDPELEAYILERALLTSSCRNRGWVLTGYPKNTDQMRMLDITATPPNRVIFIEVPARECFVRLYYRKTDGCLGDEYKLPCIEPFGHDSYKTPHIDAATASRLLSHPNDDKKQIVHDIEQYFFEKKSMMAYCGKTASYVDGDQEVDKVFELIEQILINPAPPELPRDPLSVNHGIEESYERLKKYRLAEGLFFNNLFLNPPEKVSSH